jgi:hypothetical protein
MPERILAGMEVKSDCGGLPAGEVGSGQALAATVAGTGWGKARRPPRTEEVVALNALAAGGVIAAGGELPTGDELATMGTVPTEAGMEAAEETAAPLPAASAESRRPAITVLITPTQEAASSTLVATKVTGSAYSSLAADWLGHRNKNIGDNKTART